MQKALNRYQIFLKVQVELILFGVNPVVAVEVAVQAVVVGKHQRVATRH